MADALSSIWGNLSEHLIASFWEVKRDGSRVDEDVTVFAPLTEASLDMTQNWQSPWENLAQSNLPTLQAMLQSGALQPLSKIIDGAAKKMGIDSGISAAASMVDGRSSVTKLNSFQIWSGSPPLKLQITALFRAYKDSAREVENPVNQLISWSLPVHLEGDASVLTNALQNGVDPSTVFPSAVPVLIAMKFKGRIFSPLVIESIGVPLGSPIDKDSRFTELSIPMTLCSITSIDRDDWINYGEGSGNSTIKPKR